MVSALLMRCPADARRCVTASDFNDLKEKLIMRLDSRLRKYGVEEGNSRLADRAASSSVLRCRQFGSLVVYPMLAIAAGALA